MRVCAASRSGQAAALWGLAAIGLSGCTTLYSSQEFFGSYREAVRQGGEAITAEGSVTTKFHRQRLLLRIANHGKRPLQMSYVVDEYVAKTTSGRSATLEKDDFLAYPHLLNPGEERRVSLLFPKDVRAHEVGQILATIHHGTIRIALRPVGPPVTAEDPIRSVFGEPMQALFGVPLVPPRHSKPTTVPPEPVGRAPVVGPSAAGDPTTGPPPGTVPVTVEFGQGLGTALRIEVRWDGSADGVTLAPGDRQPFYVAPGQHALHVRSRMPSAAETRGHVPVVVSLDAPTRIAIEGHPHFGGVELRVRVWRGARIIVDAVLSPAAEGALTS